MTKKPKKIKKTKITKRSTYYRWIEGVNANVKVYPCEHEKPDYKAVLALYEKTEEVLKKRDKDVEVLKIKLGEYSLLIISSEYPNSYVKYRNRQHYRPSTDHVTVYVPDTQHQVKPSYKLKTIIFFHLLTEQC